MMGWDGQEFDVAWVKFPWGLGSAYVIGCYR